MIEPGKSLKKKLRVLASLAHERELQIALAELETQFASWRAGTLTALELTEKVHQFHDGASRDLYQRYVAGEPAWAVAYAIIKSHVSKEEAGPEAMEFLASRIQVLSY